MRIRSRSGFSLVELLTVIAIIAILAAIIFPVMHHVQEEGNKTKCMANLKNIQSAIKMYKLDNRRYPERLGPVFVSGTPFGAFASHPTPGCIMGEQIKTAPGFRCPNSRNTNYNSGVTVNDPWGNPIPEQYYTADDYDIGTDGATGEVHYTTRWANDVDDVSSDRPGGALQPNGGTNEMDFERQLFRRNPPESTVVTWCANHNGGDKYVVLFLDGMTRSMDANLVKASKWRTMPPQL